jgi:hypothetical protein
MKDVLISLYTKKKRERERRKNHVLKREYSKEKEEGGEPKVLEPAIV